MKKLRALIVGVALLIAGIEVGTGPAHAGAVLFECTGAFVTAKGGQAIVVNDNWTFDVNQATVAMRDGSIRPVPFERVSPSSWVVGELPAGAVRVFVRYGLSHVRPDGTIEYWGDPRGTMEHHFDVPPACLPDEPEPDPELSVTTVAQSPAAIPANVIRATNIDAATGKLVGVTNASAPDLQQVRDVITVTGATPGGRVTGSVVAYPLTAGKRNCAKGSAAVTFSATANPAGSVTVTSAPVTVSLSTSTSWEFVETVKDETSGAIAQRACATASVVAAETVNFSLPALGFATKTAGIVSYRATGSAIAGAVDYVAVFGGLAGQAVTAEVYAVKVDTTTNKRVCSVRTPAVRATGTLAANGTTLIKMPVVDLPLATALKWEFIETVTVAGRVLKRDCATATRDLAETVRAGYLPLWYMGGQQIRPQAVPAPVATLGIARLGSTLPVRLADPAVSASTLGAGLWQHSQSEALCQVGNAVIGGHRTSAGGPLRRIHTLVVGDRVTVSNTNGTTCTYRVTAKRIVSVTDGLTLMKLTMNVPVPGADSVMTLFSCTDRTGLRTARSHRYIVTLVKV